MYEDPIDLETESMVDRLEETIQIIRENKILPFYPRSEYARFKLLSSYYLNHCPTKRRIYQKMQCSLTQKLELPEVSEHTRIFYNHLHQ